MKKRCICLLIGMVALLALMLTSCGGGGGTVAETTRAAVSLNLWIITEDETTEAAAAEVEAAFNAITEADYTTHVDIVFCTADQYKAALDAKFDKIDSKPGNLKAPVQLSNATYKDDTGMTRVLFPEVWEYQMDIVLITGQDMLNEYKWRLKDLTGNLNTTNKIIKTYINNDIMDNAAVNGAWYAVPNNGMIGEYTFMLVNKELAEDYYFDPASFTSFGVNTPAAQLIDEVAQAIEKGELTGVAPMYGMADYPLVKYWSQYEDAQSVLATMYASSGMQIGSGVTAVNLFEDANYKSFMQQMYYCKEQGYFRNEADPEDTFAVAVMEGDYSIYREYGEDYYVIPLAYPRLEDTDVFDSMFAVTNYTTNLDRSMEIIQALTCESELRNVLQYGVEGTHYELDDDGVVKRLNHNYMMNINYTGNAFKAYPEEGMPADIWQNIAIDQNSDAMLSIVFGTTKYLNTIDQAAWKQMSNVSLSYFERLAMCETVSEFEAFLDVAKDEVANSEYYAKLYPALSGSEYNINALNGVIQKWWFETYGQNG